MSSLRAILVCVDYSDILAVTLPYNKHHFKEIMVVTSPTDEKTTEIANKHGVNVYHTSAFYRDGATFNKWLALEQGLDILGRRGWICLMDADILWPKKLPVGWQLGENEHLYRIGFLYTPIRRMWNPKPNEEVPPENKWSLYPVHRNTTEWAGYSQIFHCTDHHLGKSPWHQTNWKHAGGADSFFQAKWRVGEKIRPSFEVLHIGEPGRNWCGRTTKYLDGTKPEGWQERDQQMAAIWHGRHGKHGDARFVHERIEQQTSDSQSSN